MDDAIAKYNFLIKCPVKDTPSCPFMLLNT
jgi:hypothetical protein